MNRILFLIIVYITSFIWAFAFTMIGYYFGKNFNNFAIYGLIMIVIFVSVSYLFYRYINSDEILKEI